MTWQTYAPVQGPHVELATVRDGRPRGVLVAATRTYVDPRQTDEPVYVHPARLTGLWPDTEYLYVVEHEDADAEVGDFRTAPEGRAAFTFTSYGDQGTPTVTAPTNLPAPAPAYKNDNLGSPAAGDVTAGVETIAPLPGQRRPLLRQPLQRAGPHVVRLVCQQQPLGPLSPVDADRRQPRERGHRPNGFHAYQTYFDLPSNGGPDETQGLWYSFRVGSVKVIALNNDDVCLQDAGSSYVPGYSGGAQKRWLESELTAARSDHGIDWIVICMHQVAMSTAKGFNGADIGIRREWLPLFDRYGVDLVVCGHEHHYEHTQPVRGTTGSITLTPQPASSTQTTIDTTNGTVHMIIGGGGTSSPSNQLLTDPPVCQVITSVGPSRTAPNPPSAPQGHLVSNYTQEDAIWASVRDNDFSYGFAAFTVDPGHRPGAAHRSTSPTTASSASAANPRPTTPSPSPAGAPTAT